MPLFDRTDKSRYATFSRRTLMMGGGVAAVLGALGVRLYQLQIVEGDEFRTKAEENSVNERLLAPLRGRIIDRFGVELANNKKNYRVVLIPEQAAGGVKESLDTIGRIILITPHERERILRALRECGGRLGGPDGAAARLGLKRTTLQSKLDHLGIKPGAFRA